MKRLAVYALAAALATAGCNKGTANAQSQATDRQVELTVYTQDFAQVTEDRTVDLSNGTTRVRINDVSHLLDQDTVIYDFPKNDASQVVSTTYDLGSLSGQNLLEQLVGKEVALVYRGDSGREGERQVGVLEVAAPGNIVVRVGDKLIVNPNATIETQAGEVATMPQLSAAVETNKAGKQQMQVSYMTRGLSWTASYVMNLGANENEADLELWATVTNSSGIDYPGAKIKFVAGAPNRAVVPTASRAANMADYDGGLEFQRPAAKAGGGAGFMAGEPAPLGELIAYPYESKATLRNNQTNRVLMMQSDKVKITRDYAINLEPGYRYYRQPSNDNRLKATLSIAILNNEAANLGKPLPMGTVRVYEPTDGAPVAIGAAPIGNMPKDDRIDLTLTEVFNVYARVKTLETTKLDKRRTQTKYEVTVFNEKESPLDVRLVRDLYGTWSITSESIKSTRPNAGRAQWVVNVPAGETKTLSYTLVSSY